MFGWNFFRQFRFHIFADDVQRLVIVSGLIYTIGHLFNLFRLSIFFQQPGCPAENSEDISILSHQLHFRAFGNRLFFGSFCVLHLFYCKVKGFFCKMNIQHAIAGLDFLLLEALAPAIGKLALEIILKILHFRFCERGL